MANYTADALTVSFTAQLLNHYNESADKPPTFLVLECSEGVVLGTTHYHKRAWRTESAAYVEWSTTDYEGAYPGGGTLDPALGTILYRWTT